MGFTWTIVALVVVMAIAWRFLGSYMVSVYEGRDQVARLRRTTDLPHHRRRPRSRAIVAALRRVAHRLLRHRNPGVVRHFPAPGASAAQSAASAGVTPALSWNTAVSFVTNTNWQAYSGETTMSYLSQMGALAVQNFLERLGRHRGGRRAHPGVLPQGLERRSGTSGSTWSAARSTSSCRSRSCSPSSSWPRARSRRLPGRSTSRTC